MNRTDLQEIAEIRLQEARILLKNGRYPGAYYLAGYAVECALKACIAKQIKEFDFPDRNMVNASYTHDVIKLLRTAGLENTLENDCDTNPDLSDNWNVVKDWSENTRYDKIISETQARNLYESIADPKKGILQWAKQYW